MHNLSQQLISLKKWLLPLLLAGLAGCAGEAPKSDFVPPVFPGPPDEPRFIYERSLMSSADVEELTETEKFRMFATGVAKNARGLSKPYDVAVHQGRVYVTDTVQSAVIMFDIPGRKFNIIGTDGPGTLSKPIGIDVSAAGEVYVCDSVAKRIVVYDRDGKFLRAMGGKKELLRPSGVAVDRAGTRVYVVDTGGVGTEEHRVQVYDARSGKHLMTIGKRGGAEGEFNLPLMATTDKAGNLYVVDGSNFRVEKFSSDGKFLFTFGKVGRNLGDFARPKGIAIDNDGNIYVVDSAFANFQIFDPEGQLLMFVGERREQNEPTKYMLPAGIDVDEDGRIYVVDQYFRRVDVYRPYGLKADQGYLVVPKPKPAK